MKLSKSLTAFKLTEKKYDLDFHPGITASGKFITARQAAAMINDGYTVFSAGVASHCRCSIFFWAIRDRYNEQKSPANLTWITSAGQGGRNKVPGTLEELAIPGLMTEYICSHVESAKSQLQMAEKGDLTIHIIPYGEISFLLEAQSRGEKGVFSSTGTDTFLDPRHGGGTALTEKSGKTYVSREGDHLRYHMPYIDAAIIVAPYADCEGNIYFRDAACITDHLEAVNAAYGSGGKVLVAVSGIIPKKPEDISIPAEKITGIVVNPWNEQTGGIRQKRHLPMLAAGSSEDINRGFMKLKIINRLAGVMSKRGPADQAITRMAAWFFTQMTSPGDLVNMGVGIPEEVGRMLFEHGTHSHYTFSTEAGALGGIPAPGIYFGAAINPEELKSTAWMFRHYEKNLSVAVFGFLQVGSNGDINVSKRGKRVTDFVGPGGLLNIAESARTIIFVGHWMAGGKYSMKNGKLSIVKKGSPKFVDRLEEVTFSARRALSQGKQIYYVTTVGVFRLTEAGLEIIHLMPGIDVKLDIAGSSTVKFVIPEGRTLPLIPEEVVTGRNFRLAPPVTDSRKGAA